MENQRVGAIARNTSVLKDFASVTFTAEVLHERQYTWRKNYLSSDSYCGVYVYKSGMKDFSKKC